MTIQWIVWIILAAVTLVIFITWFLKRKQYRSGNFHNTKEVITLYSIPRITIAETILLVSFLFIGVNKLHLLWLYPMIYFSINLRMGRKVLKDDKERQLKE